MLRSFRSFARLSAAAALLGLAALPAACNIGAPVAYALFGPGKTDAEYDLAPVRTVVFVDDRSNKLPRTLLRVEIGDRIATELLSRKLVPGIVATRDAIALTRQREDGAKPLSIAAIGRALECDQVIYVQIIDFTLTGDGLFSTTATASGIGATPTTKAQIKVIDVAGNERAYPLADERGREIQATLREMDATDQLRTVAQRRAAEEALAEKLGATIARLFYKSERIDLGERLGPRTK